MARKKRTTNTYGEYRGWAKPSIDGALTSIAWHVKVPMPTDDELKMAATKKEKPSVFLDAGFRVRDGHGTGDMYIDVYNLYDHVEDAGDRRPNLEYLDNIIEQTTAYRAAIQEALDDCDLMGYNVECY